MNVKEYISSGILESYVLGSCTPAEQKEVEANAMQYPEIKAELEAIREALNTYAIANEITPPEYLKEKIANAVNASDSIVEEPNIISLNSERSGKSGLYRFLIAASVALLISSAYMINKFSVQLDDAKKEIAALKKENESFAQSVKASDSLYALDKKKMEMKLAQLDMVKKPSMVAMPMKGLDPAPDAKVVVYGDAKTNEIFLEVNKLPKAPKGMQYQLWAIVKGKAIDAGMIQQCEEPDTCGILKMNSIADAHAFAISLEKEGGVPVREGALYASFGL